LNLLELLPGLLEEVVWLLELPPLLLETRVKRLTVKLLFLSIVGARVAGLDFIRTSRAYIRTTWCDISTSAPDIRKSQTLISTLDKDIRKSHFY